MKTTRWKVDHTCFDGYTMESCYWAGFLAADGCVRDSRSGNRQLRVCLGLTDLDHLHKLQRFLKADHKIQVDPGRDRCALELTSSQIGGKLEENFRITPVKSMTLEFPELPPAFHRHFVRGYFEGDGTICETFSSKASRTSSLITRVLGSPVFMPAYADIVQSAIGKENRLKLAVHPNGVNLALKFNTRDSIRFLHWIYEESTPETRLTRKHEIYLRTVVNGVRLSR